MQCKYIFKTSHNIKQSREIIAHINIFKLQF